MFVVAESSNCELRVADRSTCGSHTCLPTLICRKHTRNLCLGIQQTDCVGSMFFISYITLFFNYCGSCRSAADKMVYPGQFFLQKVSNLGHVPLILILQFMSLLYFCLWCLIRNKFFYPFSTCSGGAIELGFFSTEKH
jgi:hypothetical protein